MKKSVGEHLEGLRARVVLRPDRRCRSGRSRRSRPRGCGRRGWCGSSGTGCPRRRCPRVRASRSASRWSARQRLGHQGVVVDRAPSSAAAGAAAAGTRWWRAPRAARCTRPSRVRDLDPGPAPADTGHGGVLVRCRTPSAGRRRAAPRPAGRARRSPRRVVDRGQEGRRVDPLAQLVAVEPRRVEPVRPHLVVLLAERVDLVRLRGHRERPRLDEVAVDAVLGRRCARCRRGSRGPCAMSSSSSSGQRARPLPKPWVRLASQNPPLRPLAACAAGRALEQRARRGRGRAPWPAARSRARGSRRPRRRGRPRSDPRSRGSGAGRAGSSSQTASGSRRAREADAGRG